ncbi:MAG: EVE domain-containing protein [Bacteroidota bacterium]|nr:EVE domain-containing protein [Candidatus Kapabacteria bacterium]MDW8218970.1 EVE domain-containing protein [Bacteroidota bacterium]
MRYWLIKSEPEAYSWSDFQRDCITSWDGVRNYQARNNLRAMSVGDRALFYHSGSERAVVGIAEVVQTAYQDPTTNDPSWVCVDVRPLQQFKKPVRLKTIKATPQLVRIGLLKQPRLSVVSLSEEEFKTLCELGESCSDSNNS